MTTRTRTRPRTHHETTVVEAPDLFGFAYRAVCACSKAIDSWHHAADHQGPDPLGQAATAAHTAASAHVQEIETAAAWDLRQAASYRSRS